ncbi:hypothetical protein N9Z13_08065, partial [Luminiphilus sp.]|nr:hypothetical protein [Luminiphilus sp.]
IDKIWKGKPFRLPQPGSKMGFMHLLVIGWAKSRSLMESDQLMTSKEDFDFWKGHGERSRDEMAHELKFETRGDSDEYVKNCEKLYEALISTFGEDPEKARLPDPEEAILELLSAYT